MSTSTPTRKPYPSDVSDDEWEFVAPYLSLLAPEAMQRKYDHQFAVVFDALRELMADERKRRKPPIGFITEARGHQKGK